MTKLSERIPSPKDAPFTAWDWKDWLKELAEYVEFIDRRDRLAYRSLREQLSNAPYYVHRSFLKFDTSGPDQKDDVEYEPQTYDEAIALCKGWRRSVVDGSVHWKKTFKGGSTGSCCNSVPASWEKECWPELWKEIPEVRRSGWLFLSKNNRWIANLRYIRSARYNDSTPGRVVCQAYLVYKGHADWAERLSK